MLGTTVHARELAPSQADPTATITGASCTNSCVGSLQKVLVFLGVAIKRGASYTPGRCSHQKIQHAPPATWSLQTHSSLHRPARTARTNGTAYSFVCQAEPGKVHQPKLHQPNVILQAGPIHITCTTFGNRNNPRYPRHTLASADPRSYSGAAGPMMCRYVQWMHHFDPADQAANGRWAPLPHTTLSMRHDWHVCLITFA